MNYNDEISRAVQEGDVVGAKQVRHHILFLEEYSMVCVLTFCFMVVSILLEDSCNSEIAFKFF